MSRLKKEKDGMEYEPIYDDCDNCGEMLVLTQCQKCRKWLCMRCWEDHYCHQSLLWCIYSIENTEHAFEFTEEEKKIPIRDVLKKHAGENAHFITIQIAFNEEEAIRKRPRL